jgi:O-Antigen ligase
MGDRATKLLVVAWVCAALTAEVVMVSQGWPPLGAWAAGLFGGALACSLLGLPGVSIVLLFTYVYPVLIYLISGHGEVQFGVIWMAALAGAMLPDTVRSGWRLSSRWRAPLVAWTLVIAASATIVVFREFDFTWALLRVTDLSNSSIGGWPSFTAAWTTHVAIVLLVGILWFDWLSGRSVQELRRRVVVPLVVSFAASAAISLWQLFVDVSFLNPTVYAGMSRAGGAALDANVAGSIAALWMGGLVLFAAGSPGARPMPVALGAGVAWLAVWASGSRTALAAALIVTAAAFVGIALEWYRQRALVIRWPQLAVLALLLAALLVVTSRVPGVVGPARRALRVLPSSSGQSWRAFAVEMWNRNTYGSIATAMIREHPLFGVGVGSFHVMFPDFARMAGSATLVPDNAQNWYRHQLAEFGVIGSLPWIVWLGVFAAFVFRREAGSILTTWVGRAVLLAFAAISLVGMPGQDLAVTLTFWTLASWYVALAGGAETGRVSPRWAWAAVALVVGVFSVGTARLAAGSLRVPARAQRVGWPYAYGLYEPQRDASGHEFRWTGRHAVAVIDAPAPWMTLSVSANHADLAAHPVEARLWCDGTLIVDARLTDSQPVVRHVRLTESEKRVLIETTASRTLRPADFGMADERELGLMLSWSFSDSRPPDP